MEYLLVTKWTFRLVRMEEVVMTMAILNNYSDLNPVKSGSSAVLESSANRAILEARRGEYQENGDLGTVYSINELRAIKAKMDKGLLDSFFVIRYPDVTPGVVPYRVDDKKIGKNVMCLSLPEGIQIEVIAAVSKNAFDILNPAAEAVRNQWVDLNKGEPPHVSHVAGYASMFGKRLVAPANPATANSTSVDNDKEAEVPKNRAAPAA